MDKNQPARPQDPVPEPGLWQRLRARFSTEPGGTLRESLEGVIEQYDNSAGAGQMPAEARSMMLNLIEFAGLRVDDIMVPRADIIAIEATATIQELMAAVTRENHSRLPVFHETLDDLRGMVHIKDVVSWIYTRGPCQADAAAPARAVRSAAKTPGKGKTRSKKPEIKSPLARADLSMAITEAGLVRPILYVPPSMPAGDLLVKMQSTRIHMAIVVDEYGGTDGLVSIEDVVEEIVGDIADEHDADDPDLVKAAGPGVYVADARAPLEELEALLHIDMLPDDRDEDVDTLGGMIFSMLGRVPVRGELIHHPAGVEFEILEADPRRVRKLKIHAKPKAARARPSQAAE